MRTIKDLYSNSYKAKRPVVIINEQHTLLEDQIDKLIERYPHGWEFLKVPAEGWDREKMDLIMESLTGMVVFVSPIPYMINKLAYDLGCAHGGHEANYRTSRYNITEVMVMCNDKREKKELPNGKTISITAKTGWYLA